MAYIRQRANGTFELQVAHRALEKTYYSTHDTRADAERYAGKLKEALDRGLVPPELRPTVDQSVPVSQMLRAYQNEAPLASSDKPVVAYLQENLDLRVSGITVRWVDDWVARMKRVNHLAPGTIRKRVESLARALDWWNRQQHEADQVPANPLRMLPRGYSSYTASDGPVRRVDEQRDRRLLPGEYERIELAIQGEKREDRQRPLEIPHADSFLLMWRLIVNTGLRLREAYRLRVRDIRFDLRTVHVADSKTGRPRDIPMTRQVHNYLSGGPLPTDPGTLVFPYWTGDDRDLRKTTNRLSSQFARVFEYANCPDLTEHDLRHEAVCRWMLMRAESGQWQFRPEEVRRITGHKSVQQFEGYLSLRGSDLADRLW